MKEKFFCRPVLILCLIAVILSLLYGMIDPPFFLHFTDGLSISSVLLLLAGILNLWWKDGAFSFYSWKRENGSYSEYRERLRRERKDADNHTLFAGIWMLVLSLLVTLIYMLVH